MEHVIIINLPYGGHALAVIDPARDTLTVDGYDCRHVFAASDSDALERASRVAAPDRRSRRELCLAFPDAQTCSPKSKTTSRSGDYVLEAWAKEIAGTELEPAIVTLRDFTRTIWEDSKGDESWAEFWGSVLDTLAMRAVAFI